MIDQTMTLSVLVVLGSVGNGSANIAHKNNVNYPFSVSRINPLVIQEGFIRDKLKLGSVTFRRSFVSYVPLLLLRENHAGIIYNNNE